MTVVLHKPVLPALDQGLIRRWGTISPTITVDQFVQNVLADPEIRPIRPIASGPRLVGRAVTALCAPPDFGAVLHAVDLAGPGDVIVIAAGGHADHAMIGDILGGALRMKGVAGLICDGAVRDVGTLASWTDFPLFTKHVVARGPRSKASGSVNCEVSFGGLAVAPGDLIVGDDDGLVILSPEAAAEGIERCEERARAEADWTARLQAGEPFSSVMALPPTAL